MGDQHQRAPGTEAQRGEIRHRIVGQVAEQAGIHHQRVDRRHDREAVGLGPRHLQAADVAGGARQVLHHHRLAEPGRQALATKRAMKSGPPAGVNGTTSRIGWSGQAWPADDRTVAAADTGGVCQDAAPPHQSPSSVSPSERMVLG
jgi:hypothetical protein